MLISFCSNSSSAPAGCSSAGCSSTGPASALRFLPPADAAPACQSNAGERQELRRERVAKEERGEAEQGNGGSRLLAEGPSRQVALAVHPALMVVRRGLRRVHAANPPQRLRPPARAPVKLRQLGSTSRAASTIDVGEAVLKVVGQLCVDRILEVLLARTLPRLRPEQLCIA